MTERESRLRDAQGLAEILTEMAGRIAQNRCVDVPLRLVGIRTRGVTIAERLAARPGSARRAGGPRRRGRHHALSRRPGAGGAVAGPPRNRDRL